MRVKDKRVLGGVEEEAGVVAVVGEVVEGDVAEEEGEAKVVKVVKQAHRPLPPFLPRKTRKMLKMSERYFHCSRLYFQKDCVLN
mmetsp:Transcript_14453/g.36854  ORF Transcript_14453/g.36854 Transcript_14453/m.36854 type:complete len:84 (+) Transcript_14453:808-1059(+)